MSDTPSRPSTPAHPTKQQIDELMTLMQQMLALPVSPLPDDASAALPVDVTDRATSMPDPPARPPSSTPMPWGTPMPAPEISRSPEASAFRLPEARPTRSGAEAGGVRRPVGIGRPATWDGPKRARLLRRPRVGWLLTPLVWINLIFDRTVGRAGKAGRWLRGVRGRTLLASLGLLLLIAAVLWAIIDLTGWTW